ncbi:MAG: hypothetical protein FIA97_19445, partial [Methylococcaceae bacterium]|nr:hypothetical protein [Methylococcaceae bacterium]
MITPTGDSRIDPFTQVLNDNADAFRNPAPPEQGRLGEASKWVNAAVGVTEIGSDLKDRGLAVATDGISRMLPGMPASFLVMPHLGIPILDRLSELYRRANMPREVEAFAQQKR